jgi:hypothetical protein
MTQRTSRSEVIHLSAKEALIVAALARNGERHAYELVRLLNGEVSHDAIYVYLNRLEAKGVIVSRSALTKRNGLRMVRRFVKLRPSMRNFHDTQSEKKVAEGNLLCT